MAATSRKTSRFSAQDIRFTQSKDGKTVYAVMLGWPSESTVTLKSLAEGKGPARISSVAMLGSSGKLKWTRNADGLTVTLPKRQAVRTRIRFQNHHPMKTVITLLALAGLSGSLAVAAPPPPPEGYKWVAERKILRRIQRHVARHQQVAGSFPGLERPAAGEICSLRGCRHQRLSGTPGGHAARA